jgi:hypothetical protein
MQIHKVIFRFDFAEGNLDILDGPGRVVRTINEGAKKYWQDYKENPSKHLVSAHFIEKDSLLRRFTVEPKAIVGQLETTTAIPITRLEHNAEFMHLLGAADRIRKEYSVGSFQRLGLRMWAFDVVGNGSPEDSRRAFQKAISAKLVGVTEAGLGGITDYGIKLDGKQESIYYHLHTGPYQPSEAERYFENDVQSGFERIEQYNMICDLDVYEHQFEIGSVSLSKWWTPTIERVVRFLPQMRSTVNGFLEEANG